MLPNDTYWFPLLFCFLSWNSVPIIMFDHPVGERFLNLSDVTGIKRQVVDREYPLFNQGPSNGGLGNWAYDLITHGPPWQASCKAITSHHKNKDIFATSLFPMSTNPFFLVSFSFILFPTSVFNSQECNFSLKTKNPRAPCFTTHGPSIIVRATRSTIWTIYGIWVQFFTINLYDV